MTVNVAVPLNVDRKGVLLYFSGRFSAVSVRPLADLSHVLSHTCVDNVLTNESADLTTGLRSGPAMRLDEAGVTMKSTALRAITLFFYV